MTLTHYHNYWSQRPQNID